MTERDLRAYCPQCGSIVQPEDRFCGVCGAPVPPEAQEAAPTREVPTLVEPPPSVEGGRRNRSWIVAATLVALLILLLGGAGVLALNGLGGGGGLLGGAEPPRSTGTPHAPNDRSKVAPSHAATPDSSGAGEKTVDLSNDTSPPSEATGPASSITPTPSEDGLRRAVESYYEAVEVQDWAYTYEHLDSRTQSGFTRGEWSQKNQWLADHYPATYHILSVNWDGSGDTIAEVKVSLVGADGSSSIRNTYFVYEDGSWKHHFGQEENDRLMPDTPYQEFVEAQQ